MCAPGQSSQQQSHSDSLKASRHTPDLRTTGIMAPYVSHRPNKEGAPTRTRMSNRYTLRTTALTSGWLEALSKFTRVGVAWKALVSLDGALSFLRWCPDCFLRSVPGPSDACGVSCQLPDVPPPRSWNVTPADRFSTQFTSKVTSVQSDAFNGCCLPDIPPPFGWVLPPSQTAAVLMTP